MAISKYKPNRWRIFRRKVRQFLPPHRSCLDCGFLEHVRSDDPRDKFGPEATQTVRILVAAQGRAGWIDGGIRCHKSLWFCMNGAWDSDFEISEACNKKRKRSYFKKYKPGRTPKQHIAAEDTADERRHKWWITALTVGGSIIGALIGAYFGAKRR